MQNRYTGDIGDFGKYGLLKALCPPGGGSDAGQLSLGVVWYLCPDENGNTDGGRVQYLCPSPRNSDKYRDCDESLYNLLRVIVVSGERSVGAIRRRQVLPTDTVYYEELLSFQGITGREPRLAHRGRWARGALEATNGCDVVFIDPDNGLEVRSVPRHRKGGPKYAFIDELRPWAKGGQSLVVYQHIGRRGTAEEQVRGRLAQLRCGLGDAGEPFSLLYRRGTLRAYLVIPAPEHRRLLLERAKLLVDGPWGRHFQLGPMLTGA